MNVINSNETTAIEQQAASMSNICRDMEGMVCDNEDAAVVLIRALERNSFPSADELTAAWAAELDAPADRQMIELFLALHGLFGEGWHIIGAHYRMREQNNIVRKDVGETLEECPLYGDDVGEVRDMWADRFKNFDRKRAEEEAAAMAWLKRQAPGRQYEKGAA